MTYGRFQPLSQEVLQKHGLSEVWEAGPLEELFLTYEKNKVLDEIYALNYFSKMKDGMLNPDNYGALIVLDSFYCFNAVDSLEIAAEKAADLKETDLSDFLWDLHSSYAAYALTFPETWHLDISYKSPSKLVQATDIPIAQSVVVPSETMDAYATFERNVAQTYHPIYTLATMYPCYRLWPWLYNKINDDLGPTVDENVYGEWIKGNLSTSSAQDVDEFVSAWIARNSEWEPEIVKELLDTSINHEKALFTEASPTKFSIR